MLLNHRPLFDKNGLLTSLKLLELDLKIEGEFFVLRWYRQNFLLLLFVFQFCSSKALTIVVFLSVSTIGSKKKKILEIVQTVLFCEVVGRPALSFDWWPSEVTATEKHIFLTTSSWQYPKLSNIYIFYFYIIFPEIWIRNELFSRDKVR